MPGGAVIYVKDLDAMRSFYQRCFGLTIADAEGQRHCILLGDDWDLALVASRQPAAMPDVGDPPSRRSGVPTKLAFDVDDIEVSASIVATAGGVMDPVGTTWKFRGRLHRDCLDPEGNVVQLRQAE